MMALISILGRTPSRGDVTSAYRFLAVRMIPSSIGHSRAGYASALFHRDRDASQGVTSADGAIGASEIAGTAQVIGAANQLIVDIPIVAPKLAPETLNGYFLPWKVSTP
jgi:hypothetical protein